MTVTRPLLPILASLFILVVPLAHAETKVLTAEATYLMGDGETPSFAEAMALQKAKQMALEQAGTYVESYTKFQNLDLTTEEIQTIAGGVLQVEVLDKSRTLIGDGLRFFVKIKTTVTTDKMEELAQRIKGKNVAEEYKSLKEEFTRLNNEIESLKRLIARTPTGPDREAALLQILEREKAFNAARKSEAAFFASLISGEALVRAAVDEKAEIDNLINTIRDSGFVIEIGKMAAHPVSDSPKDLILTVPLTLKITKTLLPTLVKAARRYGGTTENVVRPIKRWLVGSELRDDAEGILLNLSKDPNLDRYFRDETGYLDLVLELLYADGKIGTCTWSNDWLNDKIRRLFPAKRGYDEIGYAFSNKDAEYVAVLSDEAIFRVEFRLPAKVAEKLEKIQARVGAAGARPSPAKSAVCKVVLGKETE
jgi:hypothetical protein